MNLRLRVLGIVCLCAAAVWGLHHEQALAQSGLNWSPPRRIPVYNDPLRAPFLVADQNRTVHAFNHETTSTDQGILVYRQWSAARGWSAPVDIILLGRRTGPQELRGVILDEAGRFHLIYYYGTELAGSIFYTWAYAAAADQPAQWSTPRAVAGSAGPVAAGGLLQTGPGKLVAVYGGQANGIGLYAVHSTDAGQTWSEPRVVSMVATPELWPTAVWLTADEAGRAHLVWHLANSAGQGEEIRYARLNADQTQWGHETTLARRDDDLENMGWGSIIATSEKLIVAYQDGFPPTRWVRQSTDGGASWSRPVRPFTHIGGYEYTALVRDSAGIVHMVLGNRIAQPEIHGMWYSRLDGELWTPLVPITSGPSTASYDPCCPRAIVSQGNLLLATWPHNVRQEFLTGAWFSYVTLEAPELPVMPLPQPNQAQGDPTPSSETEAATSVTPAAVTPRPTLSLAEQAPTMSGSPAAPVFLAVVPTVLIVAGAVGVRVWRRRGR